MLQQLTKINWGGATINADTFNVTARDFHNTVASEGDGTITADTFTLSVKEILIMLLTF